jgi:hypothetical protein
MLFTLLLACNDTEKPQEVNEEEVITTVGLSFTPASGGAALEFSWADPENDGSPVIDEVALVAAESYSLTVSFLNELENPPEDITEEVDAESDQHQLFFTGSAVQSPATGDNPLAVVEQSYDDTDANGFPVGLLNTITSLQAGSGTFTVTLRHLPPENEVAVKTGSLADTAASAGINALPGETDTSVDFKLTVN